MVDAIISINDDHNSPKVNLDEISTFKINIKNNNPKTVLIRITALLGKEYENIQTRDFMITSAKDKRLLTRQILLNKFSEKEYYFNAKMVLGGNFETTFKVEFMENTYKKINIDNVPFKVIPNSIVLIEDYYNC